MFVDWYMQKQHHNGPNYAVNCKKHGRDEITHRRGAQRGSSEERETVRIKYFSMCRRRSDPAAQIGEVSCAVHVRMGDAKE